MSLIENYKVITVTHHNLDVVDIANFYVNADSPEARFKKLSAVKETFLIEEMIYLETCNRVTYFLFGDVELNKSFLSEFFAAANEELGSPTLESISKFVSIYEGDQALKHCFELASSMDSLVVGEREIFRQFRTAYDQSKAHGLCGDYMRLLENAAVKTAKTIYNTTKIGEKPLSIVSLGIKALLESNNDPNQRLLLVGSGETNTLAGKFLKKNNFNNVTIYNRSLNNAEALSEMLNAKAFHLNELSNVDHFDTIIVCTGAHKAIIDEKLYTQMLKGSKDQKLIIDLAVPRNVSEEVIKDYNVNYVDIDALKVISDENLVFRKSEVEKARPIIKDQIKEFKSTFQRRHVEKALSRIPQEVKAVKAKAISEVYKSRLEALDEESLALVTEMMNYMEKKCISIPMKAAKEELKAH